MKRSGDVTAAAIVLFFGSGLMVLMAVGMIVGAAVTPVPPEQRAVQFVMSIFYALVAAWGIATGVGVLQLRPWARISIIVMSTVAILFTVSGAAGLMAVPMVLKQEPNMPAGATTIVVFVALIMMAVPLAIAVWWLVLFTRARVRGQFLKRSAASTSATTAESASQSDLARALTSPPTGQQIPTSIRVIAIISMTGAALVLLSLSFVVRRHHPLVIFGMLVSGWWILAHGAASVTAQTALPIYTLRKRAWALEGMIWYGVVNLANACLFLISPARNRYFEVLKQDVVPPGVNAETLDHLRRTVAYTSFSFAICVGVVCLHFLFTRRRAFWAACKARQTTA